MQQSHHYQHAVFTAGDAWEAALSPMAPKMPIELITDERQYTIMVLLRSNGGVVLEQKL